MLGAIKRRWKSKKSKVLHKGGDLSSSHDTCPAARGFVDEDFEKIIKPPSPRQIHPVSETSMEVVSTKYTNSPHSHHKSGNILNVTAKTKSSTLPSAEEPCPFIRVNSGRIELVNCSGRDSGGRHHGSPHYHLPHPPFPEILSEKLRRRLGGRIRNDSRHSWCAGGSGGSRDPGRMKGSSGLVLSTQPQEQHQQSTQFPGSEKQRLVQSQNHTEVDPTYSDPIEENQIIKLRTSLLQERLDALETLTKNCQNWQKEEKKETEAWITDLTSQVSRALTFQQVMKSEVEKLQERVVDLETHNRAMATMIVPTLMKLQETIGKARAEVGRGSDSEIPGSPQIKIKGMKTMEESWSPTSTVHGPQSLKEKKIDCRIPRINYRLNRTKHQQDQEKQDRGGDSSSSPDLTPPFSRVPNTALPRLSSPPSKAIPKSKSSLTTSTHSKNGSASAAGSSQNKSSTFSGIPRMSSPRPTASGEVTSTSGERRGSGPGKACSPSGSSGGGSGSRNGASNHKNDSPKTPCHDLHSNSTGSSSGANSAGSRLPILRKTVFPSQSPKSTKTNPSKVSSVIHHQNQTTFGGSSGSNNTPISGQTSSPSGTVAASTVVTLGKPLGKDEGYSTMSSEALAEQEGSSKTLVAVPVVTNDKDITTTIPKSNTFSTFHHHNSPPSGTDGSSGGGPLPKQLIMKMGRERNWTSLPKSANPVTVTATTTSSPSSVVRIVRGISTAVSYEIEPAGGEGRLGGGGERLMTMEDPSTSTILWEDSDDSDILFLPLELSTTSPGSSSPTLLPPSWPSSATPRLPSSTSFSNSSTVTNASTQERSQRKTRGEGSRTPWTAPDQDEVQVEERALIEKWMRLEDGRNQVHWEDEWAWDWDGVERVQIQKTVAAKKFNPDLRLPEFWTCENFEQEESEILSSPGRTSQIDSSTWTKSKKKQAQKNNRMESTVSPMTNKQKQLNGTSGISSEALSPMNEADVTGEALNPPEVTATEVPPPSPPPIEFTPAYYHLVKYGSTSSVNDNQQLKSVNSKGKSSTKTKPTEFVPFSSSDEEGSGGGKMDDKISQTDFGSSLENLSVSSELFTECRNCLELIKRLVGGIDEACGVGSSNSGDRALKGDSLMTTLDRDCNNLRDEQTLVTDNGAPTTWISVPKGLPTTEVDRILEILSSSESEDVLSPQSSKEK